MDYYSNSRNLDRIFCTHTEPNKDVPFEQGEPTYKMGKNIPHMDHISLGLAERREVVSHINDAVGDMTPTLVVTQNNPGIPVEAYITRDGDFLLASGGDFYENPFDMTTQLYTSERKWGHPSITKTLYSSMLRYFTFVTNAEAVGLYGEISTHGTDDINLVVYRLSDIQHGEYLFSVLPFYESMYMCQTIMGLHHVHPMYVINLNEPLEVPREDQLPKPGLLVMPYDRHTALEGRWYTYKRRDMFIGTKIETFEAGLLCLSQRMCSYISAYNVSELADFVSRCNQNDPNGDGRIDVETLAQLVYHSLCHCLLDAEEKHLLECLSAIMTPDKIEFMMSTNIKDSVQFKALIRTPLFIMSDDEDKNVENPQTPSAVDNEDIKSMAEVD